MGAMNTVFFILLIALAVYVFVVYYLLPPRRK